MRAPQVRVFGYRGILPRVIRLVAAFLCLAMLASSCGGTSTDSPLADANTSTVADPGQSSDNPPENTTRDEDTSANESTEPASAPVPAAAEQLAAEVVDPFGDARAPDAVDRGNGWIQLVAESDPAASEIIDTTGDGQPDTLRYDSNRDGVLDRESVDTDGDGTPDEIRTDTNGDGSFDETAEPPTVEDAGAVFAPIAFALTPELNKTTEDAKISRRSPGKPPLVAYRQSGPFPRIFDSTGNGLFDRWEYDRNGDGRADLIHRDTNADGFHDWTLADNDFDGLFEESSVDLDHDGFPDVTNGVLSVFFDADPEPTPPDHPSAAGSDTTGDGRIDRITTSEGAGITTYTDADGDGFYERIEIDSRGDGTPDFVLTSSTGDGIPDQIERDTNNDGRLDETKQDTTGDGRMDRVAQDTKGDGQIDRVLKDTNADGVGDEQLLDTTGDGLLDTKETDADGNGVSERRVIDTDGNGVADRLETDADQDGVPEKTQIDTTGDRQLDRVEYDRDGNGTSDGYYYDTDGDGKPDTYDVDADENGRVERTGRDLNGDNEIDEMDFDYDEDGIIDATEIDSDNNGNAEIRLEDTDGDGTMDTRYTDTTGDGQFDTREVDTSGDGVYDQTDHREDGGDWQPEPAASSGGGDGGAGGANCLAGNWSLQFSSISARATAAMGGTGPDDITISWVGGTGWFIADGETIDYQIDGATMQITGTEDDSVVTLTMTMGFTSSYTVFGDQATLIEPDTIAPILTSTVTVDGFTIEVPVGEFAELFTNNLAESFRFECSSNMLQLYDTEDLPPTRFVPR